MSLIGDKKGGPARFHPRPALPGGATVNLPVRRATRSFRHVPDLDRWIDILASEDCYRFALLPEEPQLSGDYPC